jgi:cytoskeletal protein CcmA (bactofilin family)
MTRLGSSLVITGDVTSDEDLTIDGRVRGAVLVRKGTLTVGESGRVQSDLRGQTVVVRGTVKGSVQAAERIELHATADVTGPMSATRIMIADHAKFNGSIDMGQRTLAAKVAQYRAQRAT